MNTSSATVEKRAGALSEALSQLQIEFDRISAIQKFAEARQLEPESPRERRIRGSSAFLLGVLLLSPLWLLILNEAIGRSATIALGIALVMAQIAISAYFLTHRDLLLIDPRKARWRFSGVPIWTALVTWDPHGQISNFFDGAGRFGFFSAILGVVVTFLVMVFWVAVVNIDPDTSNSDSKAHLGHAGLEKAVLRFERYQQGEKSRVKSRTVANVAFTAMAAISLNAFVLVGSLSHKTAFILLIAAALLILSVVWKLSTDHRKGEGLQLGSQVGEFVSLFLIFGIGSVLFVCSLWTESIASKASKESQVEPVQLELSDMLAKSLNLDDLLLFIFSVASVIATTCVPLWAAKYYKSTTSVELGERGVRYFAKNRAIFEVDQSKCTVRSESIDCRFLWPRSVWLPVELLTSSGDTVLVRTKWVARRNGHRSRYEYQYSVVHGEGAIYLFGRIPWWSRAAISIESFIEGTDIRPAHQSKCKVVSPQRKDRRGNEFPLLNLYGIPPYIPDDLIPSSSSGVVVPDRVKQIPISQLIGLLATLHVIARFLPGTENHAAKPQPEVE